MHLSEIVTFLLGLAPSLASEPQDAPTRGEPSLPRDYFNAGESLNIFSRYGYLREDFHVLPTNSSEPWVVRMATRSPLRDEPTRNDSLNHGGDIEFQFCYGPNQLLLAYFRHFSIDGIPRIWNSFLIGWDRDAFAKWMGIKKHFLSNAYSYVLVRIIRRKRTGSLPLAEDEGPSLTESAAEDAARITVGDEASVLRFFDKHGTHYVGNYTTGGLMYQVYAYSRRKYPKIVSELQEKTVNKWAKYFDFVFSPWFADHSGDIMVASGNSTIKQWMHRNLNASFFIYAHQSLLNVYRNKSLMQELSTLLGDDVIVELDLKTLLPAIKDAEKRSWVEEILMNRLALWDTGI
ncbi:torso-like protein [Hetaerina americana]|uniref:torso-like protein n=1 Tax=Hetaerina americana TaxID=62018 RepID=UPI003A7F2D88